MKLDNVDKKVLEILKGVDKWLQPSDIFTSLDKRPQAISRSLSKLLKLDLIIIAKGEDKRKKFYTAKTGC